MRDKLKILTTPINNDKESAILGKFTRKIIVDLGLINKIEFMVNRYIKTANDKNISADKKKTRSSLINNIVSEEMTWKTFTNIVFNLLKVKKCKITLELTHVNDTTSQHELMIVKEPDEKGNHDGK